MKQNNVSFPGLIDLGLTEDELEIIPLDGEVWYRGGKSMSGGCGYIGGGFKS